MARTVSEIMKITIELRRKMGVASKNSTDNYVDMATYRRAKIGPVEAAECRPINVLRIINHSTKNTCRIFSRKIRKRS